MTDLTADRGLLAYLGAAAWTFFEGETFVIAAAGLGAATGAVDPWLLMGAVWIGSFAGDQTWFALGRRYGPAALRRFSGVEARLATAQRLHDRHGTLFVLGFRFVYGIRTVASAACRLAGMGRVRFSTVNFVAAGIRAAAFVAIAWTAAAWLGPTLTLWVGVGLVALVGGFAVLRARRRRARA